MKIGDKNGVIHWTSSIRPQTVVPIKTDGNADSGITVRKYITEFSN